MLEFWGHVKHRYVKNGRPTSEQNRFKIALRAVRKLYGSTLASEFGPIKLVAVRKIFLDRVYCRKQINLLVARIRRCWKWGVSRELVPETVWRALMAVEGLRKGEATDLPAIAPVDQESIDTDLNRTCHQSPPYRLQGDTDLNLYKLFAERFWILLRPDGRLGVILPTGIYSDFGTKDLREEYCSTGVGSICCMRFRTKRRSSVPPITDTSRRPSLHREVVYPLLPHSVPNGGRRLSGRTGDPNDILRHPDTAMIVTPDDIRASHSEVAVHRGTSTKRDLAIFRTIYSHSFRLGSGTHRLDHEYAREFDMTSDSKRFPPLEKWVARGYRPDSFGRWIGPERRCASVVPGPSDRSVRLLPERMGKWQGPNSSLAADSVRY